MLQRTFSILTVLVCTAALPLLAWAAELPSTVAGTGEASVCIVPTKLRTQVQVEAHGKTAELAIQRLKARREAVADNLVALGADKQSLNFGTPSVNQVSPPTRPYFTPPGIMPSVPSYVPTPNPPSGSSGSAPGGRTLIPAMPVLPDQGSPPATTYPPSPGPAPNLPPSTVAPPTSTPVPAGPPAVETPRTASQPAATGPATVPLPAASPPAPTRVYEPSSSVNPFAPSVPSSPAPSSPVTPPAPSSPGIPTPALPYGPPTVSVPALPQVRRAAVQQELYGATCTLTVEWPLAAETVEQAVLAGEAVRKKVLAAGDLMGGKAAEKLPADEQELLDEIGPRATVSQVISRPVAETGPNGQQVIRYVQEEVVTAPGAYTYFPTAPRVPSFLYVATISSPQRKALLAKAFGNAKSQASELAEATGGRLGVVHTMIGEVTNSKSFERGVNVFPAMSSSCIPMPDQNSSEAIAADPSGLKFYARVHAVFLLE